MNSVANNPLVPLESKLRWGFGSLGLLTIALAFSLCFAVSRAEQANRHDSSSQVLLIASETMHSLLLNLTSELITDISVAQRTQLDDQLQVLAILSADTVSLTKEVQQLSQEWGLYSKLEGSSAKGKSSKGGRQSLRQTLRQHSSQLLKVYQKWHADQLRQHGAHFANLRMLIYIATAIALLTLLGGYWLLRTRMVKPLLAMLQDATAVLNGDVTNSVLHQYPNRFYTPLAGALQQLSSFAMRRARHQALQKQLPVLAHALFETTNPSDWAALLIRQIVQFSGLANLALFVWDPTDQRLQQWAGVGSSSTGGTLRTIASGEGLVGQAFKTAGICSITDPTVPRVHRERPVSVTALPLLLGNTPIAVLEMDGYLTTDAATQDFIRQFGVVAVLALQNMQHKKRDNAQLLDVQKRFEVLQSAERSLQEQHRELRQRYTELQKSAVQFKQKSEQLAESDAELRARADELAAANQALTEQTEALDETRADIMKKNADLERANAFKSQFLANMSHELRTPLNGILLITKGVYNNRAGNLLPDQLHHLKIVQESAMDLLKIINDILDISKIEAGKLDIVMVPVPLRHFILDQELRFAPLAQLKAIKFVVDISPDLPETISADPILLSQIVGNLLSNAIKFTKAGTVTVRAVLTTNNDSEEKRLAIHIIDTGIGISADEFERLFLPFEQSNSCTSREYGGTGLGLTICRRVAHALGGTVQVKSQLGVGSTFTVILPLISVELPTPLPEPHKAIHPANARELPLNLAEHTPVDPLSKLLHTENPADASVLHAHSTPLSGPSSAVPMHFPASPAPDQMRTLLVVGSDMRATFGLCRELRHHGYAVVIEAEMSKIPKQLADRTDICGVILDNAGDTDGSVDTVKRVRAQKPVANFPIVVLAESLQTNDRMRFLMHGASECIAKPVAVSAIFAFFDRAWLTDSIMPCAPTIQELA